ncbi:TPA: hypothetical protein DCW38_08380, partial [candidate division WOR-3 bacterium]|nr:hypothetical protein [candidate division WOR-3 bacterium]
MTFKKVLFLVILSVLCISVSAQFASFRSLSTAGLIDDDIEAMLAVTEMTYVEGFNIFTNLSNFNNQSEEVFNVSSHNYLVGFKASAAKMLHFGILSASNGNTSTASADSVKSVYIDNNNDEDYDAFNTSASSEGITRATNSSNNYFVFNFGKPEGIKFGISYFNMGEETLIDTFSNVDERDSNMISGDLVRISNIWRSSSSDNLGNNNYISLNGAFSA